MHPNYCSNINAYLMPNQPNTIDFLRAETFSIPTCANSNCMSHSMCEFKTVETHISIMFDMNWRRIRILIVIICTYGMLMGVQTYCTYSHSYTVHCETKTRSFEKSGIYRGYSI